MLWRGLPVSDTCGMYAREGWRSRAHSSGRYLRAQAVRPDEIVEDAGQAVEEVWCMLGYPSLRRCRRACNGRRRMRAHGYVPQLRCRRIYDIACYTEPASSIAQTITRYAWYSERHRVLDGLICARPSRLRQSKVYTSSRGARTAGTSQRALRHVVYYSCAIQRALCPNSETWATRRVSRLGRKNSAAGECR